MNRTLLILALLALPALASAQEFVPLTSIPVFGNFSAEDGLAGFLNAVYRICIGAAAVLAVLQITRAGIMYMGGDSITEKREAKHLIWMSIFGILLVLSPTIVFGIIDPRILDLRLDASNLETSSLNGGLSVSAGASGNGSSQSISCDVDFDWLGNGVDRYVSLERMGNGNAESGRTCCAQYGGREAQVGNPPQAVCDLGSLQERWVVSVQAEAMVAIENSNGVKVPQARTIAVNSLGSTSGAAQNRDHIAAHGFRTESACTAVIASNQTLLSHIRTNPTPGRVRIQVYGASGNIDGADVQSIQTMTHKRCYKVTFNPEG